MTTHSIDIISTPSEISVLLPEWDRLFHSSGSANAFELSPVVWCRSSGPES